MPERNPVEPMSVLPPENYERYFVPTISKPLAHDLVRLAALCSGERIVDVGCGTGVVTRLAAQEVGASGIVVGVDVDAGMLAVARSVTPPALEIVWRQAGAEALPLTDASFDVALCQMSLQFMEDRRKALREMHRVLVPGGRILLDLPGPATPQFEALAESMGRHSMAQGKAFVERVFSLHVPAVVEELLADAGFRDVEVHAATRPFFVPAPREFLWQYVSSTPLAGPMAGADGRAKAAFEADVLEAWEPFAQDDGMTLNQPMVFARAFK
jgi:ubiquinone/menaquinone biosynthesis C-methylase UbiE